MTDDHETVIAALLAHLVSSVTFNFTANGSNGSAVLSSVSTLNGLFAGLPVFGPNVPARATILSIDTVHSQITLSDALTANSPSGAFTTGFQTVSRRVRYAKDVTEQPALFLRHTANENHSEWGSLNTVVLECEVFIFSRAGDDPDAAPDSALNCLRRAIYESLAYDDDDRQVFTLGGLVYWCGIKGREEFDDGALDGQSKAYIPISIMIP